MKRLYRSKNNKVIAGVLGGLAEYFDQDPVLWRVGAIVLLVLTGFMPGVLFYIIAALIIPLNPGIVVEVKNDSATE